MKHSTMNRRFGIDAQTARSDLKDVYADLLDKALTPSESKGVKRVEEFRLSHGALPISQRASCFDAYHRFGKSSGST
jgi:hypothetical protein